MDWADWQAKLAKDKSLSLRIKVIPKSQRTEAIGLMTDGTIKVKVAAVPEKGKANAALCDYLAGVFGVPKRNVAVLTGETSHNKVVRVLR
ncbi:MAG: DUF167 domain-containing protein [Bryobacteraceae bacterium]